ncbi:hypothetical protein [Pendulispora albinea]|uniref:DUF11 domain-containing protein n=1 Tax=Pendulispora albinea TaxID=2741071 RepID=A0ABZ2LIS4_9BACT
MMTIRYGKASAMAAFAVLLGVPSACSLQSATNGTGGGEGELDTLAGHERELDALMSRESELGAPGRVDLELYSTIASAAPGEGTTQDFVITNRGAPTRAESRFVYVTPTFVNFDRRASLPAGCSYAYENPDPLIPEIVDCKIPAGLGPDDRVTLTFHLVTTHATLVGMTYGGAIVSPDERIDTEQNFTTNWVAPYVQFLESEERSSAAATGYSANVYLSWDVPSVAPGDVKRQKLVVGNQGPDATRAPIRLVYVSAFFSNFVESKVPRGCKLLLADPDPLMPQILECVLSKPLRAGDERTVDVFITTVAGGPIGYISASSVAAEAKAGEAGSHDPSVIDNVQPVGINELP